MVETLAAMRRRNFDERVVKINRARDRIEAENRARVEAALSAMRLGHRGRSGDVADRLEQAPAHLRRILAIFMSPAFKQAFLAYAQKVARGEIAMPSASALAVQPRRPANGPAASSSPSSPGQAVRAKTAATAAAVAGSTTALVGRSPPPRRAISLDCPETVAEAAADASAPPPGRGAERRRQGAFGDVPPTKSEAILIAAGEHRLLTTKSSSRRKLGGASGASGGGHGRGSTSASGGQRRVAGASSRGGASSGANHTAVKWRKHREGSDFNLTFTADTAVGRAGRNSAQAGDSGGAQAAPARGGAAEKSHFP